MANIYIPYIYPLIVYNINANNNDKPSTQYPLILTSQPSTSTFVVPNPIATVIGESESEPSGQQVQIDKSLLSDTSHTKVKGEWHKSTEGAELIMSEPDKPNTRTQRRKRGLEADATSPAMDEAEPSAKRKPRGRGGKKKGLREAPKKLAGTSFNICSNCGTVADKIKAKKCKNCQKFFFDHWAKRCRIPPCPNCHFSRKSRGCEVVPQFCERCGHPLKGDAKMDGEQRASIGEASSIITEGESTSDTSSFQLSEDLHDIDNLSQSEDEDDESVLEDDVEKDSCLTTAHVSKVEKHEDEALKSGLCESGDRIDEGRDTRDKSHDISDETVDTSDKSHDISVETSNKSHVVADQEDTNDKKVEDCTDSDMRDESHDHADDTHETSDKSHDHTEPQVNSEAKLTKTKSVEPQSSLGVKKKPEAETNQDSSVDISSGVQATLAPPAQIPKDNESTPMETSEVKVHESSNAVDSSTTSLPLPEAVNTTSQAEVDLRESKDSVDTTDTGKINSPDTNLSVECDSQAEAASGSRMEPDIDATSTPLKDDVLKNECVETAADGTKSDNSIEVGKSTESTDSEQKQSHQDAPIEQSQETLTVTSDISVMEAEPPVVEGPAPREETPPSRDVDNETKQEVTSIWYSSPTRFDEQVGADVAEAKSSLSLVLISRQENPAYSEDHEAQPRAGLEDTAAFSTPTNTPAKKSKRVDSPSLTKSKGKSSKKASAKSSEKKSPKKRSKKKASIETTVDCSTTTAAVGGSPLLVAGPPQQEVTDGATQKKIKMEDLANTPPTIPRVSLISSSEVGPLQSTPVTVQSESSVEQLLKPLVTMTRSSMVTGLLNNLVERLNQKQLAPKEENPSSPLGQGLQPSQVGGSSERVNQQLKQSQQQCQQLINKTALLLNPNSDGAGNGTPLLPSGIQLPQKRAVSETAESGAEEGDLLPTSSKKLKISYHGSPSEERTSPAGTPFEASPATVDSKPSPIAVMEQSSNAESQCVSQEQTAATRSSVIQSPSKLFPRSASLPPQLVPSSSLARQESDDDSFPLSSTPCLSHTLRPPPLKPTSPTCGAGPTAAISVLSSSESIPVVSLPSLISGPSPPELKPVSDTFTSHASKLDSSLNVSTILEGRPSSQSSVIMRAGPSGSSIQMTGEPVSFSSSHVTGSDPLQSVKVSGSRSLSLSTGPAAGSFHRLEIGSPPAISGQSNKIRVSLLKPEESSEAAVVSNTSSANASGAQSPSDGAPSPMTAASSMAIGGKFQNFALTPNLSVIATVETTKTQASSTSANVQQVSGFSPANSDSSSDSKPKSDSQEPQKITEDKYQTGSQDSSRQCTPEDIEEQSCLQKISLSAPGSTTSVGSPSPSPVNETQLQQPQVPSLVGPIPTSLQGPIPNLPILGRPGAVSVTVIKSSSQIESDSLFSNAGVQATNDRSPDPLGVGSSLPSAVSSSNNIFGAKLSSLSTIASLPSPLAQGVLQPGAPAGGLPSVGVQAAAAAPASNFRKIAPRKPGQSGLVTIQVCNTIANSNSVTAAKMSSQSVGVGTEPSASQASNVRMSPGILRPRPSAQIGGVFITPQPSVGATSPQLQPNGQGVLRKPTTLGGGNGADTSGLFPSSPPSRSVYVTKLYSNVPSTATTQTGPQGYNPPRVRPSLKELSSPAFEEALLSASKQNAKQAPQEEEEEREKEKPPKKEKKRGGKGKAKEGGGKSPGKSKKNKGKSQADKAEKFATDEAVARLMSEEVLDSESDQISETGSHNGSKKKPSTPGGHSGKDETGESRDDVGERNDNEEDKGERGGDGDKPTKKSKNVKTGGKKDSMKLDLYSVKLKDCFLHHMLWQDYRVVLLVPLNASGGLKTESPGSKVKSGGVETTPTPERKRRRKSKIEPLDINEIEAEMDPLVESPATSSTHIHSPCFSVYELRNKLFSESNAVYAYTYKNQIKTLKPPLHWVHVLKRMGGMQENCHTCRLLDVGNVKGMSQHYGNSSSLPSSLESLCKNELPKGRKVIDLSSLDPEDLLESGQLDKIPQCSFLEKPLSKKKTPSSSKKKHKKQPVQASPEEPEKDLMDEFLEQSARSLEQGSSSQLQSDQRVEQSHDLEDGDRDVVDDDDDDDDEGRLVIAQQETEEEEEEESMATPTTSRPPAAATPQRSPPPLIKHESPSSSSKNPQKKKFCPDCGTQIARKCKKCPTCGKRFGVFTFGRKLCPGCGRVNLARMTACYECGHSMQFAQKALPKGTLGDDADSDSKSSAHRSDYVFGSRKRRRVPPLPYSSEYDGYPTDTSKAPKLSASAPGSRLPSVGDADDYPEQGDGVFPDEKAREGDDITMYEVPGAHAGKKSKHLGYQYGRVPWGDADITCLVGENGTPKFCLQELCSKVLRNQVKADVFDMVKNLNLPVLQGDTALLKKLQALGLHSNRSPICRLIAAEELWTLLDALQEPVPEEVHQHLENISSSTTPLLQSPSHTAGATAASCSAGPVLHSPGLVAGGPNLIEEDEHGFQSTLHEMECSDGQYISILRTWNGEQYACLTEVWRKYFPEVNRNHLTSALKRLGLDTHMPTGQQATLLRSAGVISLRGAAGRLMRLEDTQMLLDDFGIPLQISPSSDSKEKPAAVHAPPLAPPRPTMKLNSGASVPPHISRRKMSAPGNFTNHMVSSAIKTEPSEDMLHAECMRNILAAISYDDLVTLLEKSRDEALSFTGGMDEDANAVASELDSVQQLIHSRRELCNILSSEIGYLTASNHGYMAEIVRLNHSGKQILQDLESSLLAFNIILQ